MSQERELTFAKTLAGIEIPTKKGIDDQGHFTQLPGVVCWQKIVILELPAILGGVWYFVPLLILDDWCHTHLVLSY